MIGHDIIDLNYQAHASRWKEERYWQKVLQQEELDWVKGAENPFLAFLIYWAIKEAAYKLVCDLKNQHRFIPKKFIIKPLYNSKYYDSIYFHVNSPFGKLFSKVQINNSFIQASATAKLADLHKVQTHIFPLSEANYFSQSSQTQISMLDYFASKSSFGKRNLEIRKKNSIPSLYISGNEAPIALSISHHGHWGAFAYVDMPL